MPDLRKSPLFTTSLAPSLRRVRFGKRLGVIACALLAGACIDRGGQYLGGTGGASSGGVGAGGGGAVPGAGGADPGAGGIVGSGGVGTGGVVFSTGGTVTVDTVDCTGDFPAEDVSGGDHRVSVDGTVSWGPLPHFWTTYGLGRMGLYLPAASLAEEFAGQDKTNFDGGVWSTELRAHTLDAVENLELRSVRGHGLFHDDIGIYSEDESGNAVYDFSRSDQIFDFLVENGIAPIVELASMPRDLALDPTQTVFDWEMIVSPPKDYDKWGALVQAFVAHSVERYTADIVDDWYFEVWNEPECCSGKFWKGTPEDYFLLYDKAAAGVKAALPNGRVGGPVTSQPQELTGGQWEGGAGVRFLDHINANSGSLDFFTFHTWSFINGAVGGYFQGLDLLDSKGKETIQVAVTEFGPTWEFGLRGVGGEPDWEPQETGQGAAFVAQVYSNIAQRCAMEGRRFPIAYAWWTLSDVFDEGFEDPADYVLEDNPFIGAMGLINREGIKKPAYNAYKFLAQMGNEQLPLSVEGLGDVGGMAARSTQNGGVQLIVYNGQDPGAGFSTDEYYTETGEQTIGISVGGLNPEMAYDVTSYRVDEVRGNAFGAWDTLGRPAMANMSEADWQLLRDNMQSPAEPVAQAVCGTSFSKSFSLSSPGVLFVTIEPAVAPAP